jgi:hypothetical protein
MCDFHHPEAPPRGANHLIALQEVAMRSWTHIELPDQVAKGDGAFTRHDSASQFSRDSGAAAMSAAAWNL